MAAPPSADEFIQRSFFSSIFNVRLKTKNHNQCYGDSPRYNYRGPFVRYNEIDERMVSNSQIPQCTNEVPSNTSNIYLQNQSNQLNCTPLNNDINTDIYKPPLSLTSDCENNLLIVNNDDMQTDIMSPQEIYNEIITESAEFEHTKYPNDENPYYNQNINIPSFESTYTVMNSHDNTNLTLQSLPQDNNNFVFNYHSPQQVVKSPGSQYQNVELNNQVAQRITEYITPYININQNMNLEQIIKIVIATMKESTVFPLLTHSNKNNVSKNQIQKQESPEAILQRKRQQNNEAAARYRQRQKEAKKKFDKEIDLVKEKNTLLKKQVAMLEKEIKLIESILINNRD
uniref:BZIP domain-containing protein n=1 Tax=Strongyloides papillosus TaxID=174720 RepID=A0A0N5C644_STREA